MLQGGRKVSDPTAPNEVKDRTQALKLLISAHWAIGEAQARGISISEPEVQSQINKAEGTTFPGGEPELREFLASTGQTVADVELQARAQVAAAKLRQAVLASVGAPTSAQVTTYYAEHEQQFHSPGRREARFSNRKTKAAAMQLKHEVEAGERGLTSRQQQKVGELFTTARVPPTNAYEAAIDSARPHKIAGPFKLGADYFLYQVVRVYPPRQRSLAEVSVTIRRKLLDEGEANALAELDRSLRTTWTARTDCKHDYVIQKCRQYTGAVATEDPLAVL